jgi:hypothetical protein
VKIGNKRKKLVKTNLKLFKINRSILQVTSAKRSQRQSALYPEPNLTAALASQY